MKITRLPPPDLSARANQYVERSDGLHFSRVMHDILCTLDPDRYNDREGGPNYANFFMGLVLERALEMAWADKEIEHRPNLVRPGEFRRDGIIITPDAFDTGYGRPEEFKLTKKSCRQDITDKKFWLYWVQLQCQAYVLGVNSGVLWVCYVNGNYSRDPDDPESGYIIIPWLGEFSETEMSEKWEMIVGHAKRKGWL